MKKLVNYMRSRGGEERRPVPGAGACCTAVMLVLARQPHRNKHGIYTRPFAEHVFCFNVNFASSVMRGRPFTQRFHFVESHSDTTHTRVAISTEKIGDTTHFDLALIWSQLAPKRLLKSH
jgi:hypothetical protein